MSERRAAIIFLMSRARSRCPADRARARHPAPRRAKKSTGAGRVPARGEANSFSAGMANLAVRVRGRGFSCWPPDIFDWLRGARAGLKRGPAIFVFLASVLLQAGQLGHRRPRPVKRRLNDPYSKSRPPFDPPAGVAESRAHPAALWPGHTAKRLALAAARLRESDGTACNQSTLDAIEA